MHAVAASGARSAPYGYVIGRVHFMHASSGKWCAERTLRVCYWQGAFYAAQVVASGARSAPYGYVIGRMHFMHAVAASGARSAPYGYVIVGCILCTQ
jgi:hypothetical protein